MDRQTPLHFNTENFEFKVIGIVGRPRKDSALQMHKNIFHWLLEHGFQVLVEAEVGEVLAIEEQYLATLEQIGEQADLAIVIGGDGNMLGKARVLSHFDIAVVGVNRGNLGFLTDIDPENVYSQLYSYLINKDFFVEERFLLDAYIQCNGELIPCSNALNEVVIHPARIAHMIDFQVYIDNKFAFSQRSDGLIISTPTGSTAYSLSAGGPILTPNLNAIALVSMFPHTLSSRPIVIDGDSQISLSFASYTIKQLALNCDSHANFEFTSKDRVLIKKSPFKLKLLHLKDYNYFNVLGSKLGWLQKLF